MTCANHLKNQEIQKTESATTTTVEFDRNFPVKRQELMPKWNIEEHVIFETVVGSRLFGTDTPESDTDRRGICLPPASVLLNLYYKFEQQDSFETEKERAIYSLDKFLEMASDCNPNIVELLFVPDKMKITQSPLWEEILANRDLFISQKAKDTFWGYAIAQLRRIERHHKWMLNPPTKPTRAEFGLPEHSIMGIDHIHATLSLPLDMVSPGIRETAAKEKKYREAKVTWEQYEDWQKNRNPARFELEQKYGYDTKHAMHLVRLLEEGKELLLTGKITLPRPEAGELKAIKKGKYTYEELMALIQKWDYEYRGLLARSPLPRYADKRKINQLYLKIVKENCF